MYDKPSFKYSLKENRRCIIPATGFFEWMDFNKKKYPHFIHVKSSKIFSLAGLYSVWTDKSTGEEIGTYTVLTTKANPLMERVHNLKKRMPVILPKDFEKDWLNPNLSKDDVLALCLPYPESDMDAYTITKLITDRAGKNKNSPAINEPFTYTELS